MEGLEQQIWLERMESIFTEVQEEGELPSLEESEEKLLSPESSLSERERALVELVLHTDGRAGALLHRRHTALRSPRARFVHRVARGWREQFESQQWR